MRSLTCRRAAFLVVTVLVAIVAGAPATALAVVSGPQFGPTAHPRVLHLSSSDRAGNHAVVHWTAAGRFRALVRSEVDPVDDRAVIDELPGRSLVAVGTPRRAEHPLVERRPFPALPDGSPGIDLIMSQAWPFVARQRGGQDLLRQVRMNGRPLLRGTIPLAANDCADLPRGTLTVLLDPATFVPRRTIERRTGMVAQITDVTPMRGRRGDFAPVRTRGRASVVDTGFQRLGAAAVAARVSYPILMPTVRPAGFRLVAVGHAVKGGVLGPEGSFPRSRGVFQARWMRGLQQLDLTIRPAHGRLASSWDNEDPFGGECESTSVVDVQIGDDPGSYVSGESGPARLWWRDGQTLFTLAGPFGADQLVEIAESLQPVASS